MPANPAPPKLPLALLVAALLLTAAPAWSQLTCNLTARRDPCIGQKGPFTLTATASGCTGPYTFTWTNVKGVSSPATANPNSAYTMIYPGQCTTTVSMSVSAMGYTCTRSLTLYNSCDPWCGVLDP